MNYARKGTKKIVSLQVKKGLLLQLLDKGVKYFKVCL